MCQKKASYCFSNVLNYSCHYLWNDPAGQIKTDPNSVQIAVQKIWKTLQMLI